MENESFKRLSKKGDEAKEQHDDMAGAAHYYEQALQQPDGSTAQKLSVRHNLGRSYIFLGKEEATAVLNDVIEATENIDSIKNFLDFINMFEIGYRSRYDQVLNFRAVMESEPSAVDMKHILTFIKKDCFDWLAKYDHRLQAYLECTSEEMKAPFLTELAIVYFYQGEFEKALDTAEEGYSLAKEKPTIIALQYHAMIAARYARKVGDYQRSLEILNEIENLYRIKDKDMSPYSQVQLLTERLRLLLDLKPQKIQEAVGISQNILHLLGHITTTRALVEAYCETGKTFVCAKMYDKSLDALQKVQEISLKNTNGYHKKFLLRKGFECYKDCLSIIGNQPDVYTPQVHQQISRWLEEITRVYSVGG